MEFRKDLNGLRAIAVIAVVLFHFNASWAPGGFAGVDVFFVISGYLMTGIIFNGLESNNFSTLRFYNSRANRIIPALAVLCLALLVLGWFYLTAVDYKALGKHAAGSMGFVSNFIYWRESGYFNSASHEKWLLHTWSLSVEWQFYIIYPLVLVALRRMMSLNSIKVMIFIFTVLGFIFSIVATYKWHNPAYYLLPTRAWEMLIGGVAYLYPWVLRNKIKKVIELLGVLLILASYFLISKENPWPGYLAIFPVFGTFLIIQSHRKNSIITGNFVFQKLGAWSYSIYLWHWPIVVAIYYYSLHSLFIYIGILLSVLLGFLSHKYIENIDFKKPSVANYLKNISIIMAVGVSALGLFVFASDGIHMRFPPGLQMKNKSAINAIGDWYYPSSNLRIGQHELRHIKGNTNENILFIGASHIEQTYPYVESFGSDYNIYYLTKGGCLVTPSYKKPVGNCLNIQGFKKVFSEINFEKVVTSFFVFDSYLSVDDRVGDINTRVSEYDEFLKFVKSNVKEVFVILGEPIGPEFDPKQSLRHDLKNHITKRKAKENYALHYRALGELTEINNVVVIDPIEHLCGDVCMVMDKNHKYYYKDADHMRPWYSIESLGYLEQVLK